MLERTGFQIGNQSCVNKQMTLSPLHNAFLLIYTLIYLKYSFFKMAHGQVANK